MNSETVNEYMQRRRKEDAKVYAEIFRYDKTKMNKEEIVQHIIKDFNLQKNDAEQYYTDLLKPAE